MLLIEAMYQLRSCIIQVSSGAGSSVVRKLKVAGDGVSVQFSPLLRSFPLPVPDRSVAVLTRVPLLTVCSSRKIDACMGHNSRRGRLPLLGVA